MSRVEPWGLRVGDERVLREWTRASSISAGLAQRARIVLLAAQARSNVEIAALVGVSLPTVRSWRRRYAGGGACNRGRSRRSRSAPTRSWRPRSATFVGIYLDPPVNAVVVCIDEKTQIQALDHLTCEGPGSTVEPGPWQ